MLKKLFEVFQDRRNQNVVTTRIAIKGMTCKNCVHTIKKALFTRPGMKHVLIDLKTGIASITYDANQTDIPTLNQIIVRKGYFPEAVVEPAKVS